MKITKPTWAGVKRVSGKGVIIGAALAIAFGTTSAIAGPANSVSGYEIVNGSITSADMNPLTHAAYMNTVPGADQVSNTSQIAPKTIDKTDLSDALQAAIDVGGPAGTNGNDGKSYGCDGNVVDATHPAATCPGEPGADSTVAGPTGPAGPAASDVKGDLTTVTFAPKVIENIGGKYFGDTTAPGDDRYTLIGTYTLPAGKWQINTSVKFTRTATAAAGDPAVRPQVGLRIGQDQTLAGDAKWGTDLGTVGGEDISPVNNKDLWGQAVGDVTLTEATEFGVYGHGFTDNEGTQGSGQIKAAVKVFATRG